MSELGFRSCLVSRAPFHGELSRTPWTMENPSSLKSPQHALPSCCLFAPEELPAANTWRKLLWFCGLTLTWFQCFSQLGHTGPPPARLERQQCGPASPASCLQTLLKGPSHSLKHYVLFFLRWTGLQVVFCNRFVVVHSLARCFSPQTGRASCSATGTAAGCSCRGSLCVCTFLRAPGGSWCSSSAAPVDREVKNLLDLPKKEVRDFSLMHGFNTALLGGEQRFFRTCTFGFSVCPQVAFGLDPK